MKKHEKRIVGVLITGIAFIFVGYFTTPAVLVAGFIVTMGSLTYFSLVDMRRDLMNYEPFMGGQWTCECEKKHSSVVYGCRECGDLRDNQHRKHFKTDNE